MSQSTDTTTSSRKPAHERFLDGRAEKRHQRQKLLSKRYQRKKRLKARKDREERRRKLVHYLKNYHWQSRKEFVGEGLERYKRSLRYHINHPAYVSFLEKYTNLLCGRFSLPRIGWFYYYFNPSQFHIKDPRAPRTVKAIGEFFSTFRSIDKEDMKQIIVIALWEIYGDLTKLPYPRAKEVLRRIRKPMKKWFYWMYREAWRTLRFDLDCPAEPDTIDASSLEETNTLFLRDLTSVTTNFDRYFLYFLALQNESGYSLREITYSDELTAQKMFRLRLKPKLRQELEGAINQCQNEL